VGRRMLAWAMIQQGHPKEGVETIENELQQVQEGDMVRFQVLLNLAQGYDLMGQRDRACALVDQWWAVRDKLGITAVNDSFFYDLRAKLRFEVGDYAGAEKDLRAALAVGVQRGARLQELRSATGLARLLATDRREEARRTLSEVYGWFTEGFDLRDLIEAKALLQELG
jgi:hypothetical protein